MRSILLLILWTGRGLFADVVTLNDGRTLSGSVESGNTQELHLKAGDQTQTIDIHDVQAIQFGVSSTVPAAPLKSPPETRTLILKDGTRVTGRWWSIDASQVHFLVDNRLQHYPRSEVLAVTSGNVPPPPPPPTSPPAASPPPRPAAAATQQPPVERPPASPPAPAAGPARPPTLQRPAAKAPPAEGRGVSQPDEIGAVYLWNGRNLTPLEHSQAVERKRGSTSYWEMAGAQSHVRVKEVPAMAFIVRLPRGVNPASYSLFPLATAADARQTRAEAGRKGGLLTWPFEIQTNNESGYMTYAFIVKDLPAGEYSFSPSNSNDSYCFGVDPSAGQ